MKRYAAVLLLLAPALAAAQFKCRDGGGKIVYSDSSCPAESQSVKIDGVPLSKPGASTKPTPATLRPRIEFAGPPETRLVTVKAVLESLAVDGSACEWNLKVDKKWDGCARFAPQMQAGAEWTQVLDEVKSLLNEPGLYEARRSDIQQISRLVERVSGYSQFMQMRLRSDR